MIERTNVHLAIAFDENYVTLCYVLLTSVFSNNRANKIVVHAIATGVSEKERKGLQEFTNANGGEMFFYDVAEKDLEKFYVGKNTHVTIATYYRFFFTTLVPPEVKKLIYIDTDIVVINDLAPLYNTDTGSKPVAAVVDTNTKTRPELGIHKKESYFNAGVLLIDVPKWNEQQISEKAIKYFNENPEKVKLLDQDALNAVLVDNWHPLPIKYNVTIFDIPADLGKHQYDEFLSDKVIIHYTKGRDKPWRILGKNRFRYLYHHYLKLSPRKNEKLYTDFKPTPKVLYNLFKIRAKESILDYPKLYRTLKKSHFL